MKIIFNATNLKQGGALHITHSLLEEFKKSPGDEFHVLLSPQLVSIIDIAGFPANFRFYNFSSNPISSITNILRFQKQLSALERDIKPDFVFTLFGPALWKPKAPHLVGFANGLYLYDDSKFIKERWPDTFLKRIIYKLRRSILLKRIKHEADVLWTETEYSKQRLCSELGLPSSAVNVVSNTCSEIFKTPEKHGKPNDIFTFIYITADYPHKNLEIFSQLIPMLEEQSLACSFQVTLPEDIFEERFPEYVGSDKLVNLGFLSPEQCVEAYRNADALFFPSFIETFSSSYPEAMVMEKPIITSDAPFAHDICQDSALYFDPFKPEEAVKAIKRLVYDASLQHKLVEKGLERLKTFDSAGQRAEKLLNVMKDYLNNAR